MLNLHIYLLIGSFLLMFAPKNSALYLRCTEAEPTESYSLNTSRRIYDIAWNAESSQLGAAQSNNIILWEPGLEAEAQFIDNPHVGADKLAWHPTDAIVASIANTEENGFVNIWNTNTLGLEAALTTPGKPVHTILWLQGGHYLLTLQGTRTISLWEYGTWVMEDTWDIEADRVYEVGLSSDQAYLAAGVRAEWAQLQVYDIKTHQLLNVFPDTDEGWGYVEPLAWQPDQPAILAGFTDLGHRGFLELVEFPSSRVSTGIPFSAHISWHPCGCLFATADAISGYESILQIRYADGEVATTLLRSNSLVSAIEWSPDGTKLAIGDEDGVITVWETHVSISHIDSAHPQVCF